jgi:hypothetical protein
LTITKIYGRKLKNSQLKFVSKGTFNSNNNAIGKCDIHAEQKNSVMNETKQYEIWSKLKICVQKIFDTLLPKVAKGFGLRLA